MKEDSKFALVLGIVIEGLEMWIEWPRAPRSLRLKEVRREDEKVIIECEWWYKEDGGSWVNARIDIDAKTRKIDWARTSSWLFNQEHKGSGAIGVAIFTLPITIPLSPILLAARGAYRLREKRRRMFRHGAAILDRIGKDLDAETRLLLEDALRAEFDYQERMNRRISLKEARELLQTCRLHVAQTPTFATHSWYAPDGAFVAQGDPRMYNELEVKVLGSSFRGPAATDLLSAFAHRDIEPYD